MSSILTDFNLIFQFKNLHHTKLLNCLRNKRLYFLFVVNNLRKRFFILYLFFILKKLITILLKIVINFFNILLDKFLIILNFLIDFKFSDFLQVKLIDKKKSNQIHNALL